MTTRILIRGGHVLTMDPELGDLSPGDVLVEGEKIAAIAPAIVRLTDRLVRRYKAAFGVGCGRAVGIRQS